MNKHGFKGVRKRTDGRAKPFYARVTVKGEYIYLASHDTPEAAAEDFKRYITEPKLIRKSQKVVGGKGFEPLALSV